MHQQTKIKIWVREKANARRKSIEKSVINLKTYFCNNTNNMEVKNNRIALLVDGDNAQSKMMDLVLEEASKYGKVTIRRVYGDWTTQHMKHWKSQLNEMAFNPIQKFSIPREKIRLTVH